MPWSLTIGQQPPTEPSRTREIDIVLAEYVQIESEKRMVAQALLALTGLLLAGIAAIAASIDPADLLPVVVLGPAGLIAAWAGAILKSYADEYVLYLAILEEKLQVLSGSVHPPMGWNRIWAPTTGYGMAIGAQRVASIGPLMGGVFIAATGAVLVGLYAVVVSGVLKPLGDQAIAVASVAYVVFNLALAGSVVATWFGRTKKLKKSRKAFRMHHGLAEEEMTWQRGK